MTIPSSALTHLESQRVKVFISHAGEDKYTIAEPIRDALDVEKMEGFLDVKDIRAGSIVDETIIAALGVADIAVIVLSPEFVAKKWPMFELMQLLERHKKASLDKSSTPPIIVPVFYRLPVSELFDEPNFERRERNGKFLYERTRFKERQEEGHVSADITKIKASLKALHNFQGVENKNNASNDPEDPFRVQLIEDVVSKVSEIAEKVTFESMLSVKVNFIRRDKHGKPALDPEGNVWQRILTIQAGHRVKEIVSAFPIH